MKLTLVDYNKDGNYSELSYYNKELDNYLRELTDKEFKNVSTYLTKNTELSISLGTKQYLTSYVLSLLTCNKTIKGKYKSVYTLTTEYESKIKEILKGLLKMKEILKNGYYWEYEVTVLVHYKKETIYLKGFYNYCNYKLTDSLLFEDDNQYNGNITDNLDNLELSKEFKEKIKEAVSSIENGNDRLITDVYCNNLKTSCYDIQKNEIEI